jgi:ferredoxin-NADP reductase
VCLYGVRRYEDAVDVDRLSAQCDLRLAVSRERRPGVRHGRVTGLLADLLADLVTPADRDYYVCGLDAMIDEVTAMLEFREVPLARIHRECFFNASYET